MKQHKLSFELQNNATELDKLCRHLNKFGQTIGLSQKSIFQINLALDELFTNIISYGYNDKGRHRIHFVISCQDGTIVIRVEDNGVPFDVAAFKSPDPKNTLEDCKVGGLGLHLIRKLMDEISYERQDDKNIVTLKKCVALEP
jgi:anti-sigma regulatory factor (Ser/Thr protein kinase)